MSQAPHSLSPLGTSGERAGERGTFHWTGGNFVKPLSLSLSPLLRREERGSTTGVVVASRCARGVFELPRPAEIHPLDHVKVAARIHTHGVRGGEERGVGLVVSGSFAIAELRYCLVAGVKDRDAAGEVRDVEMAFVLVHHSGK